MHLSLEFTLDKTADIFHEDRRNRMTITH